MKNIFAIVLFFTAQLIFAQQAGVSGQVLDAEYEDQPLAFAEVKVQGLDIVAITDESGYYALELMPGSYTLEVDFIGYETLLISEIEVGNEDQKLNPVVLQAKRYKQETSVAVADNNLPSNEE